MDSQLRALCCVLVWFVTQTSVAAEHGAGVTGNRQTSDEAPGSNKLERRSRRISLIRCPRLSAFSGRAAGEGRARSVGALSSFPRTDVAGPVDCGPILLWPALWNTISSVRWKAVRMLSTTRSWVRKSTDSRTFLGSVRIVLVPSSDEIRFDLVFTGLCRSRTQGVNEVVVLQNTAETQFEAHKEFVWNSNGLTSSPTVAAAETRSKTHQNRYPSPWRHWSGGHANCSAAGCGSASPSRCDRGRACRGQNREVSRRPGRRIACLDEVHCTSLAGVRAD